MTKKYWNPLGDDLPNEKLASESDKNQLNSNDYFKEEVKKYRRMVSKATRERMGIILAAIIVLTLFWQFMEVNSRIVFPLTILILFFLFAFYIASGGKITVIGFRLQKEYYWHLYSNVILENGWRIEQNVFRDQSSWQKIVGLYPLIFRKGDTDQTLEKMVWGWAGEYPFWKTIFSYQVEYKDVEHNIHYRTEKELIMAFKAKKKICNGYILLQGRVKNIWQEKVEDLVNIGVAEINKKQMPEMELIDFNRAFFCADSQGISNNDWHRIFSPVMQRNLVEFWRWYNRCNILINNDEFWVVTEEKVWGGEKDVNENDLFDYEKNYSEYKDKINRLLNNFVEILDNCD